MSTPVSNRPRPRSLLLALAVPAAFYIMYFAGLGANPFLDPDEPIYAVFVKGMVSGGDWLTPHYAGRIWFDKPPLFYWLSSGCVKLIGLSELAIRMPSAVFAALTVLMVFLLTSYDFGKRAGMLAAAVMGTTLMQIILSHAAVADTIMVFLMTAALYAYRRWIDSEGRTRLGWITLGGAAAGFGMLAKGPVVPLLLAVTFVVHLAWIKQLARVKFADVLLGAGAALIVGLPWYLAMYSMHGKVFVDQFIVTNNLARFARPLHPDQTGQWYSYFRNIPLLLAFFFPWSVFLPQAVAHNWPPKAISRLEAAPTTSMRVGSKLAFCWVAVTMVFFSLSKTQNFTYTYPAFAGCALMLGTLFADRSNKGACGKGVSVGLWIGLVLSLMISAAVVILVRDKFPQAAHAAIPTAIVMALLFVVPIVWTLLRGSNCAPVPWIIAAGMLAFSLITICVLMPAVSEYMSCKALAQRLGALRNVQVVAYRLWRPSLGYYLEHRPLSIFEPRELQMLACGSSPVLAVCNKQDNKLVDARVLSRIYGYGTLDIYANHAYLSKFPSPTQDSPVPRK